MTPPARWTLPLIRQAAVLRARGLSSPSIAIVLAEYHDLQVSAVSVRGMLRTHGGAIPRPRGSTVGLRSNRRAA